MPHLQQKAVYVNQKTGEYVFGDVPVPEPQYDDIVVKLTAVGFLAAGIVQAIGPEIVDYKVGDLVITNAGFSPDGLTDVLFGQYYLVKPSKISKITEGVSAEKAVGFKLINKGEPIMDGPVLLVLGADNNFAGETMVACAKQFTVATIATADPANGAKMKALGATHIVDRRLSPAAQRLAIHSITMSPNTMVFDCIGVGPENPLTGVEPDDFLKEIKLIHQA